MHRKTVIIIDDNEWQVKPLADMLTARGFELHLAPTVVAARLLIQELGGQTDVMIIDMELDEPGITGAEVAIQAREQSPKVTPEFLILTGHEGRENYYKQALLLGAAAYLEKKVAPEDVIRHVRALALKRALRFDQPRVMAARGALSESTVSISEAVRRFARDLLAEELGSYLGAPYMLLLTDERGTQNIATNTGLPTIYASSYHAVQIMAHGDAAFSRPYPITERDLQDLPPRTTSHDEAVFERLLGAVLIPLADMKEHRLSLVLLAPLPGEFDYPEDARRLADVLAQYARPAITEHFLGILIYLKSHRRAMLLSLSLICLHLGQHQQRIVEEGIGRGELAAGSEAHLTLTTMSDDLRQTGTILNAAADGRPDSDAPPLDMRDLIEAAFEDYSDLIAANEIELTAEASCRVSARRDDMYVAVKRLLDWMVQRRTETPSATRQKIGVRCAETDEGSTVVFEDHSRRLSPEVREQLFEPFSASAAPAAGARGPGIYLPLYTAKVLFEEKYGGRLDDTTTELEGEHGHRFTVRFGPAGGRTSACANGII